MPYKNPKKQKAFQREWIARRRAEYFAGKSCVQCGSSRRLELDHIDPEQKVTHRIWSLSLESRTAELAKCQVLCHRCHYWKTVYELPFLPIYQTNAAFPLPDITKSVTRARSA